MNKTKNIAITISITLLLLALFDGWPYGYFTLLRIVVTGTTAYSAWLAYDHKKGFWIWSFVAIAIIFNPIIPLHLGRELWLAIDLIAALFLFLSLFFFKLPNQ